MIKKNINNNSYFKSIIIILIILFSISVLGIFVGSICDLQFSKKIVGTNDSQKDFQWYFSGIPGIVCTFIFGFVISNIIVLPFLISKWNLKIKIIYLVCSLISGFFLLLYIAYDQFMSSTIYEAFHISNPYSDEHKKGLNPYWMYQGAILSICIILVSSLCIYFFIFKKNQANLFLKWSIYGFLSFILSYLVVDILKQNIHRERYFQLLITGEWGNFKPWYSLLWNMNISDDDSIKLTSMTSFPSGHVNQAMNIIVLIPLFLLLIKNKKIFWTLSSLCISFVIVTMFCRVATGSHYLSDVSSSVLISTCCYLGTYFLIKFINDNINIKN